MSIAEALMAVTAFGKLDLGSAQQVHDVLRYAGELQAACRDLVEYVHDSGIGSEHVNAIQAILIQQGENP